LLFIALSFGFHCAIHDAQISGAKVMVHEARSGSSDRTVIISGTPDETQAAQSLLHAFILTGPA